MGDVIFRPAPAQDKPKVPSPPARVARGRERVRLRGAVQYERKPILHLVVTPPHPPPSPAIRFANGGEGAFGTCVCLALSRDGETPE